MFLGLDIGTSGVKAVVVDEHDRVVAQAGAPLAVSRPQPLWAEQDPEEWWQAVTTTLDALAAEAPKAMAAVQAIGLSGQMLGVALLDAADRPIRPALLWNDGRASAECAELERCFPASPTRSAAAPCRASRRPSCSGWRIMNRRRLPQTRRVLLTKDYVRLRLSGEAASDRADSSATLLMDTRAGDWHEAIVAACGLDRSKLPRLDRERRDRRHAAPRTGRPLAPSRRTPIVGGAGDNMCAGVGVGAVTRGRRLYRPRHLGRLFPRQRPLRARDERRHAHASPCRAESLLPERRRAERRRRAGLGRGPAAHRHRRLMTEVEAARLTLAETPSSRPISRASARRTTTPPSPPPSPASPTAPGRRHSFSRYWKASPWRCAALPRRAARQRRGDRAHTP